MESTTYYLKYRPQKIEQLDILEVREGLQNLFKSGKVPHALLFTGPRGTGKTSAARIVAKAINCTQREINKEKNKEDWYEPCNKCDSCVSITNGTSMDLIEIDGASNRGIEDMRDLKDKIRLAPSKAKYKVYIIDEVHMLTTEAFNALLKTLEEPPAHAVFVLCTTDPQKVLATIISRCTRFNFPKAKIEETIKALRKSAKGEKLDLEKGVLEKIAGSAEGSFRDAQKILDQLSSSGEKITMELTLKTLGRIEELDPLRLLACLAEKDLMKSMAEIAAVSEKGGDIAGYLRWLLEQLRIILLYKIKFVGEDTSEKHREIADMFQEGEIIELVKLFSQAGIGIKSSPIPQLPLELAVIEYCANPSVIPSEQGESRNLKFSTKDPSAEFTPSKVEGVGMTREQVGMTEKKAGIAGCPAQDDKKARLPDHPNSPNPSKSATLDDVIAKWPDLLTGVKPLNHSVEALLKAARPYGLDENGNLTIEVFYKFHKERLETEKCRSIIEQTASEILQMPIKVKCVLGAKGESQTLKNISTDPLPKEESQDIMDVAKEIFK